ncbi:MAG TPA: AI-2E family transporter [Acidimicrobiales bacterium]
MPGTGGDAPAPAEPTTDPGGIGREPDRRVVAVLDARTFTYIVVALLAAAASFAIFRQASDVLTRVAVGVVLALALDPLVGATRRRFGWRRRPAVVFVSGLLFAATTTVVLLLGPPAVDQAAKFSEELPATVRDLYDLPVVGPRLEAADAATKVEQWIKDLPATIDDKTIASAADRLVGGAVNAFTVVVVAFAVLLDGEQLVARIRRLVPASRRASVDRAGRVLYRTFGSYFGGSLTVAVLMGLYVLTLGLILGVPLAPLAAIWAMITDLIPQVGGFLGGAFFVTLALTQGVVIGLLALVLFVVYMNVENHMIQPAIIGQAVDLTPPTTMLAALVGGAAAGVPGALVATPLVGAAKVLYRELRYGPQSIEPKRAGGRLARLRSRFGRAAES